MGEYDKLINYLSNYKQFKSRLEALEIQLEYAGELEEELAREKEELERKIGLIEAGLDALDQDQELSLIRAKYLQGKINRDNLIYDSRLFPYSSSQYYRVKRQVLEKLKENIGDLL
ncbi:hypothetical protein Halha_2170 [Halobacteroides halobius DSM 5150]|uniref:Phage protein n=1 Tax=Halobacteroides halobius (strain ATCC 35273 / DSM 5150 / MD-1) TaxID=748449 RepID=L0K9R8_HALHC|nr:hypothetical protein [Halobacteroides halobius]AGB42052.1 hypothetical protein Halha_2170 [Halobacteroides halobius DSM 5150]